MENGSYAQNGILPMVPSNTSPTWPSILTGANTGTTGITNNSYHDTRTPITQSGWGEPGAIEVETLPQVAERYGLRTAVLGGAWTQWPPEDANLTGPAVGWGNWHSQPIVMSSYEISGANLAPYLFMDYKTIDFNEYPHELDVISYAKPMYFKLPVTTYSQEEIVWTVIAIDTTNDGLENYDRLLLAKSDDVGNLQILSSVGEQEWVQLKTPVDGTMAGMYVKVLNLDPDLEKVRLYGTAMQSVQAFPTWLEKEMVHALPAPVRPSRDALMGGFVDEETFLEEVLLSLSWAEQAFSYVIDRTSPDLVLAWFPEPDEIGHRMAGYLDPGSPLFSAELASWRNDMFRKTYEKLDKIAGQLWQAIGGPEKSSLFIVSDHGMVSIWEMASVNDRLAQAGLYNPSKPENSKAIAYSAGAVTQIYINLEGRQPSGIVPESDYSNLQNQIVELLNTWVDDEGNNVLAKVFTKEETKNIKVSGRQFSMYNPFTTGDIVAFAAPPFQFDAATPGQLLAPAMPYFTGQHGYLADTVPKERGTVRAVFAAGGQGIRVKGEIPYTAALFDISPTISYLLDIPAPANAEGNILTSIITK